MVALEDSDPLFPEFLSDCPAFGRVSFDAVDAGYIINLEEVSV